MHVFHLDQGNMTDVESVNHFLRALACGRCVEELQLCWLHLQRGLRR